MQNPETNIINKIDAATSKRRKVAHAGVTSIARAVLICGKQGIALRGHEDNYVIDPDTDYFNCPDRFGNFNAVLFAQLGSGDDKLRTHLKTSGRNAKFVTADCQNEMISIAGNMIRNTVIERFKAAKFFSVLADGTTDISKIDQFSIVLRYCLNGEIHEDFVDFLDVSGETKGAQLAETILSQIKQFGLEPTNLKGQGYDGASNMSGICKGASTIIMEEYPNALYTHCSAHVLNLVLGDACEVLEIKKMFGTVNDVAVFFGDSAKRNTVLDSHISSENNGKRLQLNCNTRWAARFVSLERIWTLMPSVLTALAELVETGDTATVSRAHGLESNIKSFPFFVALVVGKHFLGLTHHLSTQLQSVDIDYVDAMLQVKSVIRVLEETRANITEVFEGFYKDVKKCAADFGIEEKLPRRTGRQQHRNNIDTNNAEEYYRVSIAIPFIDYLNTALKDRFSLAVERAFNIAALLPNAVVSSSTDFSATLLQYKDDLPDEGSNFSSELVIWKSYWNNRPETDRPRTILSALRDCSPKYYPTIHTLLHLFAVLPVSVADCERSFSTLRRLKTYLRSTMSQERLVSLALLNIHNDIFVTPEEVAAAFMAANKRRIIKD